MKYALLVILLVLGYEGYVHWQDLGPVVARARTKVATLAVPAAAPASPAVIPGQPAEAPAGPAAIPGQPAEAPASPATIPGQPPEAAPAAKVSRGTPTVPSATMPLAARVAAAQQQAVAKYPALGVANSEMNSRFVFRYKHLVAEQSARLQDGNWPLRLADECAAASGVKVKAPPAAQVATR